MSTPCKINFYENEKYICTVYHHSNGYPDGVGNDIKEFIKSGKFINGLSINITERLFNGFGDCVAQYIAYVKKEPGSVYMISEKSWNTDYDYYINFDKIEKVISFACKQDSDYRCLLPIDNDI